jgi:hypothetical protein
MRLRSASPFHKTARERPSLLAGSPPRRRHRSNAETFEVVVRTLVVVLTGLLFVYLLAQAMTIPPE